MFENLLGQDEARSALKADLEAERLPPAILLSGPPGSGKLTAALELARVLSCAFAKSFALGEGEGGPGSQRSADALRIEARMPEGIRASWNCPCPSCSRHRSLVHPDIVLLGPRSFPEEIPAALELLGRAPGPAASYFFVRAARKLLRRFDAALYEGEESRLAKAAPLMRELEEELDAIAPEKARAAERSSPGSLAPGAATAAAKATAASAKLEAFVPDAPPVFMIRNVELWARLAPMGSRKTAIFENADRMLEGSRNALLKILEEPPESVRFVLASSRRNALMATILSRARTYHFAARDAAGTALVIERVFRSEEPAPSVESYLAARRPFPPSEARAGAEAFLAAALGRGLGRRGESPAAREAAPLAGLRAGPLASLARSGAGADSAAALSGLLEATKDFGQRDELLATSFRSFLAALSSRLGDLLREEGMDASGVALVERIAALVREASGDYETLNRSPGLIAEALMYAIGETASTGAEG